MSNGLNVKSLGAIIPLLPPPYLAKEGGVLVIELLSSFILSVMAGVLANYISKWLNGKKNKGNQPKV